MANKTITQLTGITPTKNSEFAIYQNGSTGKTTLSNILSNTLYADGETTIKTIKDYLTDDTVYPITKASAVYLNDDTTTVEGLLGNSSLNTEVQTVTGAINEINENLNSWIVNKNDTGTSETEGYYVRMGVDKDGNDNISPFAYIDLRDANNAGSLLANLIIAGPQTENEEFYHDTLYTNKGVKSIQFANNNSQLIASLSDMVPETLLRNHTITSQNQLDTELHPGWLYSTSIGTSLGLPSDYFIICQYWYSTTYKFQLAQMVNTASVRIYARSQSRASGATTSTWGDWYTVVDNGTVTITAGTGIGSTSTYFRTSRKNGVACVCFATTMAARTYTGGSSVLFTVDKPPLHEVRTIGALGSTVGIFILKPDGTCVLNNTYSPTSSTWIQGSFTYPYK